MGESFIIISMPAETIEVVENQPQVCICCLFLDAVIRNLYCRLGHGSPSGDTPRLVLTPESFALVHNGVKNLFSLIKDHPHFIDNPSSIFGLVNPSANILADRVHWMHESAVPNGAITYNFDYIT